MDLFKFFFSKLDIWVKSFNFLKAELGGSLDKFDRINFSKLKILKTVISPFF